MAETTGDLQTDSTAALDEASRDGFSPQAVDKAAKAIAGSAAASACAAVGLGPLSPLCAAAGVKAYEAVKKVVAAAKERLHRFDTETLYAREWEMVYEARQVLRAQDIDFVRYYLHAFPGPRYQFTVLEVINSDLNPPVDYRYPPAGAPLPSERAHRFLDEFSARLAAMVARATVDHELGRPPPKVGGEQGKKAPPPLPPSAEETFAGNSDELGALGVGTLLLIAGGLAFMILTRRKR